MSARAGAGPAVLALWSLLLVAACTPLPPADDDGLSLEARRTHLTSIPRWEMRGRIAIETGADGFQGRITWIQRGESLLLSVRGPFGAGSFEIEGTPPALTFRGRGETFELDNAEPELSAWLGWWMPVTSLPDWLRGLPDTDYAVETAARRRNLLDAVTQRAWTVRYRAYTLVDGILLPSRIELAHRDLEIRLSADEWRIGTAASVGLNAP